MIAKPPPPGTGTQSVFDELARLINVLESLQHGGGGGGSGGGGLITSILPDFWSEVVILVIAAAVGSTQTYTVQHDGWISGVASNVGTAWTLSVNVDPPSAQVGGTVGVYSGHVYYGPTGSFSDRLGAEAQIKIPVKTGDLIRAKQFGASITAIEVILSYAK